MSVNYSMNIEKVAIRIDNITARTRSFGSDRRSHSGYCQTQGTSPAIRMTKLFILVLAVLASTALAVQAQTVYHVRAGSTGANNGTDWANAYTSLPGTLVRGATYYVADGSYPAYNFSTPQSGSSLVTIRKATTANHGTSIGWQDNFGDGQAQFGPLTLSSGFFKFDGAVGGGPGSWKNGHGFKIASNYQQLLTFTKSLTDVSIHHTEFAFPSTEVDDSLAADHIYAPMRVDRFTLEYSYLHDSTRTFLLSRGWVDVLVQYNCFARNRSTPGRHAEGWSDHNGVRYIIRHNLWEDIEGTGCIVMLTGSAYDWEIYGNVVYWSGNPNYGGFGNGTFTTRTAEAYAYNWKIYNNTVVNGNGKGINAFHKIYNGSGNEVKNNLWYNSPVAFGGAASTDFNWYIKSGSKTSGPNDVVDPTGADPFIDAANLDFRLKTKSPAGVDVKTQGKQFDVDPVGVSRLTWTRGAYEGAGAVSAPKRIRISN